MYSFGSNLTALGLCFFASNKLRFLGARSEEPTLLLKLPSIEAEMLDVESLETPGRLNFLRLSLLIYLISDGNAFSNYCLSYFRPTGYIGASTIS